jgi:hypothetical protein
MNVSVRVSEAQGVERHLTDPLIGQVNAQCPSLNKEVSSVYDNQTDYCGSVITFACGLAIILRVLAGNRCGACVR